jgi:CO/xanthine dehydrogenase Mo-binding subunit
LTQVIALKEQVAGEPIKRIDAREKVEGTLRYVSDMVTEEVLYVKVVRSSVPHAIIKSIDVKPASNVSGVVRVVTAGDIPGDNLIGADQPLLAQKKVRYIGEAIVLVVADDPVAAKQAAEQVSIDYEPLQPLFSIGDALSPGAPKIHENGNIKSRFVIRGGDATSAFEGCDVVVEGRYSFPFQEHAYLETESCMAIPEEGQVTVVAGMQVPFAIKKEVSKVLGGASVRVVQAPTGGAFGGKEETTAAVCAQAALSAYLTGKPCLLACNRKESVQLNPKRHAGYIERKLGAMKDGRLVALQESIFLDGGAYLLTSPAVLFQAVVTAPGPYQIPNLQVEGTAVFTNKIPSGAFRGFGRPQAVFAGETQMDELAKRLKINPLELRLKNLAGSGETMGWGQKIPASAGIRDCIVQAGEVAGWPGRRDSGRKTKHGIARGMGMAVTMHGTGLWPLGNDKASAVVELGPDGAVVVKIALTEYGQGISTGWVEIVRRALGVSPTSIRVANPDTKTMNDSGPTVASRSILFGGRALYEASLNFKASLLNTAGRMMMAAPETLALDGDRIRSRENGREVKLEQVAAYSSEKGMAVRGESKVDLGAGTYWDHEGKRGSPFNSISFAAHIAGVEVDTQTGLVTVRTYHAVHDSGKILNRKTAESMVYGGVVQGLGYALTEELQFKDGKPTTSSFLDYMIPTFADAPDIHADFVETYDELGPFGAKGLGEVPLEPVAAAVGNAIADAIGISLHELPFTPDRVLAAIEKMREKER